MNSPESRGPQADLLWRIYELVLKDGSAPPARRRELETAIALLQETLGETGLREAHLRRNLNSAEAALAEAREQSLRYHELFEYAPDAYVVTDLVGTIQDANFAATRLFGSAKEFLVGKPLPFFVHPEDRRAFYSRLARLHGPGEPAPPSEARLIWPGRKAPAGVVSLTVALILSARERPIGLRWLLRDVTDQKEAEDARQAALAFIEGLLESAQVLVLVIAADGGLMRTNAHLEEVSGYRRDELAGTAWQRLLFGTDGWPASFRDALVQHRSQRVERTLQTRSGRTRTVVWAVRPVRPLGAVHAFPKEGMDGAEGSAVESAVLAVGHDITVLQQAQAKAVQLERLAAIGQTAAGLAHESRNAIQRGQACLERLHWKLHDQPETLALVERAQKAQEDLLRLYESVRDYAAPIRVDPTPCDPREVWREVWDDVRGRSPGRDAELEEEAPPDSDCASLADRFALAQVLRNLFENALAACADPVRVRVSCRAAELNGRPALRIAVCDNGPGFGDEQRRRAFEPFYTTKPKGTGLGLAIVKRIVEAHGGEIALGDPPSGAEIIFTLPRSMS